MQQCCEQQTQTRRQCRRVPYQVQEEVMIPGRPGIRMPDIRKYIVYNKMLSKNDDKNYLSF